MGGVISTGDNRNKPIFKVVVIEQAVSRGGGAVWRVEQIADVSKAAKRHGMIVHMDGARILNAVVASGVPARDMTRAVDTVWRGLGKGKVPFLRGMACCLSSAHS